jgi:protein PhnA
LFINTAILGSLIHYDGFIKTFLADFNTVGVKLLRKLKFTDFCQNRKRREMEVKDSNGNILSDGDSVSLIKDLKVKGTSTTLKRGTMVKNIRITDNPDEVDCRVNKVQIVLKTAFLKKA